MEAVRAVQTNARLHTLVLVRHGESEWNRRNLFTGQRDPDLTEKGLIEARVAGRLLKYEGLVFDLAFTSKLKRAVHTLEIMLAEIDQSNLEVRRDEALNERKYGDLSGLNKDEARDRWGEEKVLEWRRSYDVRPPGGESLKDTEERVMPYYQDKIWPKLEAGNTVLITAHGTSLRALIMNLANLSGEEILARELATGAPIIYLLAPDGSVAERRDLLPTRSLDAPPEDNL